MSQTTRKTFLFPYTTLFRSPAAGGPGQPAGGAAEGDVADGHQRAAHAPGRSHQDERSEEHTSELQSRGHLVCRLLLEKKKMKENMMDCMIPKAITIS